MRLPPSPHFLVGGSLRAVAPRMQFGCKSPGDCCGASRRPAGGPKRKAQVTSATAAPRPFGPGTNRLRGSDGRRGSSLDFVTPVEHPFERELLALGVAHHPLGGAPELGIVGGQQGQGGADELPDLVL